MNSILWPISSLNCNAACCLGRFRNIKTIYFSRINTVQKNVMVAHCPKKLLDTPFKEIRLAIQNYISPEERVVMAERAKFLSVIQGVGESEDDFLARLREEARYCDFEKLKTVTNPEEELVKIKLSQVSETLRPN